jgi:hypothetical protein
MDFTQAVAIVISSELAPPMIDMLMLVSPDMQARINAVLVCKNKRILLANPQVPKYVCPTCLLGRQKSWGNFPKKKYS